jgi:hypothetical protein
MSPFLDTDTAVARWSEAALALAIPKRVIALSAGDAHGIDGTLEIIIARQNDAESTDHFEPSWASALLHTLAVDLCEACDALTVIKTAIARTTGNADGIGRRTDKVGTVKDALPIDFLEACVALAVIEASVARKSRDAHSVGWARKVRTVRHTLAIHLLEASIALTVVKVIVAIAVGNAA